MEEDRGLIPRPKTSQSLADTDSESLSSLNRIVMGCRVCRARKVSGVFILQPAIDTDMR